jgi:protein SCO1
MIRKKTMRRNIVLLISLAFLAGWHVAPYAAFAHEGMQEHIRTEVKMDEQLGRAVDLNLTFTDHTGKAVRLADYFTDGKPVLLTLNYFTCTTMCSILLENLARNVRQLGWIPGDNFRMVTVDINPAETVEAAAVKRAEYLKTMGAPNADWSMLVGTEENIRSIADQTGFRYVYDAETKQYGHPMAIIFLSPKGIVARYLYGMDFAPRDLKFALIESSQGRLGSPIDKVIITCYHFDPTRGTYGPYIMGILRLTGAFTILVIGAVMVILWRREAQRKKSEARP